jgi:hypothetical protein
MSGMDDLIAFISARLDEEGSWWTSAQIMERFGPGTYNDATHIVRHDPARMLREVIAKRAHLAQYESAINGCLEWGITTALENILYSDAAVWSDHPDYRQEWTP